MVSTAAAKQALATACVSVVIAALVAVSQCGIHWDFCSSLFKPESAELERARSLVEGDHLLGMTVPELEELLGSPWSQDWVWVYGLSDPECYCESEEMWGYLTKCHGQPCLIVWLDRDGWVCATTLDGLCSDADCTVIDVLQRSGHEEAAMGESLIGEGIAAVFQVCGEPDRETRRYVYHLDEAKGWGDLDNWWLTAIIDRAGRVSSATVDKY